MASLSTAEQARPNRNKRASRARVAEWPVI
jgi:hypothetical protein